MRILHVNKFGQPRGGAEIYMLRLAERQAAAGHDVAIMASAEPSVIQPVRHFDVPVPDFHGARGRAAARAGLNVIWSRAASKALQNALNVHRPTVVHFHNYAHQLSPAVVAQVRRRAIPSVYTAHDYKLICPAYIAAVDSNDCFACAQQLSGRLIRERCHHESWLWSALVGLEGAFVRRNRLIPDKIIAPSYFMREALRDSWLGDYREITLLRNPVESSERRWQGGSYLLYVGRLSREKGLQTLLSAAANARIPLHVAGEGPLRASLESLAQSLRATVVFHGHVDQATLARLREKCLAQVIPSEWPENAPLAALEAAAEGVPLVVTSRGGVAELATVGARLSVVRKLHSSHLRDAVKRAVETSFDPARLHREIGWEDHLRRLTVIYQKAQVCG